MAMRASRLARLTYVRPASRLISTEPSGPARLPVLDNVNNRPQASTGFRGLASLASSLASSQPIGSDRGLPATYDPATPTSVLLQVQAVDELLRSGIGGSDVWSARLRGAKEDFATKRPRRIAGKRLLRES
jgi:hypothetical protein